MRNVVQCRARAVHDNNGITMGVDHGERGTRPPEFEIGDANENCRPQIMSYRYKKERSVSFKIRQNPFSDRARRSQGPVVGWEGTPLPILHPTRHRPTFGARHASPRIPARSTPMDGATSITTKMTLSLFYNLFAVFMSRDRKYIFCLLTWLTCGL